MGPHHASFCLLSEPCHEDMRLHEDRALCRSSQKVLAILVPAALPRAEGFIFPICPEASEKEAGDISGQRTLVAGYEWIEALLFKERHPGRLQIDAGFSSV